MDLYCLGGIDRFLNIHASYIVLPNICEFNILHVLLVSISVSAVINTDLVSLMLINRKLLVMPFTRA